MQLYGVCLEKWKKLKVFKMFLKHMTKINSYGATSQYYYKSKANECYIKVTYLIAPSSLPDISTGTPVILITCLIQSLC
jgi:hypothetical protein